MKRYPETFHAELLDVTDKAAIREVVNRSFTEHGRIDVIISHAGYGLFGVAEELSDEQIKYIVATKLLGPIQLIRVAARCHTSAPRGRTRHPDFFLWLAGSSMYHAIRWGIEGFVESVAQEVAPFGIGMTIVEPGGARTGFSYGSAQVAQLLPIYEQAPAHSFLSMLDPKNGQAPGDPPEWPHASLRVWMWNPRCCALSCGHKRWKARWRPAASGSRASNRHGNLPLPQTARLLVQGDP